MSSTMLSIVKAAVLSTYLSYSGRGAVAQLAEARRVAAGLGYLTVPGRPSEVGGEWVLFVLPAPESVPAFPAALTSFLASAASSLLSGQFFVFFGASRFARSRAAVVAGRASGVSLAVYACPPSSAMPAIVLVGPQSVTPPEFFTPFRVGSRRGVSLSTLPALSTVQRCAQSYGAVSVSARRSARALSGVVASVVFARANAAGAFARVYGRQLPGVCRGCCVRPADGLGWAVSVPIRPSSLSQAV